MVVLDNVKDGLAAAKNDIRQPSNGPDGSPKWCKCAHCQGIETLIEKNVAVLKNVLQHIGYLANVVWKKTVLCLA